MKKESECAITGEKFSYVENDPAQQKNTSSGIVCQSCNGHGTISVSYTNETTGEHCEGALLECTQCYGTGKIHQDRIPAHWAGRIKFEILFPVPGSLAGLIVSTEFSEEFWKRAEIDPDIATFIIRDINKARDIELAKGIPEESKHP